MLRLGFALNACCFLLASFAGNDLAQLLGVIAASSLFVAARRIA